MSGYDDKNYTTVVTAATTYTLGETDYWVSGQSLTGATAWTLPAPTANRTGRQYILHKDASAQTVTITPASGNIDGGASVTLATGAVKARIVMCDGTGWWTVSQL
jgi:hypothetical protein